VSRTRLWVTLIVTVAIAWGSLAAVLAAGLTPKLGLDLQGGFSVLLTAPEGTGEDVLDTAVDVMRRRIENLGAVQEPEISVLGNRGSIQVQLPGVQDRERALEAVGTTGELSFRPVLAIDVISPAFTDGTLPLPELPETEPVDSSDAETTTTTTSTTAAPVEPPPNIDPETGLTIVDDVAAVGYLQGEDGLVYMVGPAFLTGSEIAGAESGFTPGFQSGGFVVDPEFTDEGAVLFEDATAQLSLFPVGDPRRQMAIVVDGVVVSAPQIAAEVAAGEGLDADQVFITVGTSDDAETEAEDLATILRYGALPTVFERERVESVSASLGSDSLQAGLVAGVGGLLLVAIAMVLYYRALGLVAVVGLTVFGSLLMLSITLLSETQGTTLTLAGVTGIIVSIGITADSYIVFFERIKEEHRRGRPLRGAVDHGFERAFRTILTADAVTFMGSVLLYVLAIGAVKGFALTLGLATIIDVLVAYFFTRPLTMLMVRGRLAKGGIFSIEAAMGRRSAETTETAEVMA
jgi:preprotein translocase subunit SecD